MVVNEPAEDEPVKKEINNKKKVLVFLIPALIVIGICVALYQVVNKKIQATSLPYRIVKRSAEKDDVANFVVYNLPELVANLKSEKKTSVSMRISIEFKDKSSADNVEALTPKIMDSIISVTSEMTPDDIEGARGLYWLKEEILHRVNLLLAPIEVSNVNFRSFDIQKGES